MTVKEYRERCEKTAPGFFDFTSMATEIWSNNACLGYAILAMRNAGLSDKKIREIVGGIKDAFGETSLDEADKEYCKSPF